jgi:hypothetical protein
MSTGRRVLFAVLIAIAGWRLRELIQWKADSEDNDYSCYDVTPRDGTECWILIVSPAFLADDTIFDKKRHYY